MVPPDSSFCLNIDSHMDMSSDWDSHMLQFWKDTNNEYVSRMSFLSFHSILAHVNSHVHAVLCALQGILTTYVADKKTLGQNLATTWEVPHLCEIMYTPDGIPRNSQAKAARMLRKPALTTIWAAGLSFGRCHFERRVPVDPALPFIFDGEEYSRTIRAWTWGYDFYTPPRTVIVHDYNRVRKGHWVMHKTGLSESLRRLRLLIGVKSRNGQEPDAKDAAAIRESPYGLGPHRSLEQFIQFSGIDPMRRTIGRAHCANPTFVPWTLPEKDTTWPIQWPPPKVGELGRMRDEYDPAHGGTFYRLGPGPEGIDEPETASTDLKIVAAAPVAAMPPPFTNATVGVASPPVSPPRSAAAVPLPQVTILPSETIISQPNFALLTAEFVILCSFMATFALLIVQCLPKSSRNPAVEESRSKIV